MKYTHTHIPHSYSRDRIFQLVICSLVIFILFFISCSPALPGGKSPEIDFTERHARAEKILLEVQAEREQIEKLTKVNIDLLEEAKALNKKVLQDKAEADRKLQSAKGSERRAQRLKRDYNAHIAKLKKEAEEAAANEAAADNKAPGKKDIKDLPYSLSDAPEDTETVPK